MGRSHDFARRRCRHRRAAAAAEPPEERAGGASEDSEYSGGGGGGRKAEASHSLLGALAAGGGRPASWWRLWWWWRRRLGDDPTRSCDRRPATSQAFNLMARPRGVFCPPACVRVYLRRARPVSMSCEGGRGCSGEVERLGRARRTLCTRQGKRQDTCRHQYRETNVNEIESQLAYFHPHTHVKFLTALRCLFHGGVPKTLPNSRSVRTDLHG